MLHASTSARSLTAVAAAGGHRGEVEAIEARRPSPLLMPQPAGSSSAPAFVDVDVVHVNVNDELMFLGCILRLLFCFVCVDVFFNCFLSGGAAAAAHLREG